MHPRLRLFGQCASIALCAAVIAFAALSLLHATLEWPLVHGFDLRVQARVHGWASPGLTIAMKALTWIGSIKVFLPTLAVSVAGLLLMGEREGGRRLVRKRQVAALFALGIGGALVLNDCFKLFFHRARPTVPWSIGDEHTFSFPSGHSLFSLVLYGLIAYNLVSRRGHTGRRVFTVGVAAMLVLGIGVSRIYLGMHWPTDVIAGYLTGGVWLSAVILVDRRWRTHRLHRSSTRVQPSAPLR